MILPHELSSTVEIKIFGIGPLGGTAELDRGRGGWYYHIDYLIC